MSFLKCREKIQEEQLDSFRENFINKTLIQQFLYPCLGDCQQVFDKNKCYFISHQQSQILIHLLLLIILLLTVTLTFYSIFKKALTARLSYIASIWLSYRIRDFQESIFNP